MSTTSLAQPPQQIRERAIQLAREGQQAAARELLHEVLRHNPADELALLWLAQVSPYQGERIHALEQALAINPANPHARQHLMALRGGPPGLAYAVPMDWQAMQRRRPGCLTLLAVLFILGALLAGFSVGLSATTPAEGGGLAIDTSRIGGSTPLAYYVVGMTAINVLFALLGGVGLLLGRRWGWSCAVLPLAWWAMSALITYQELTRDAEPYELGRATAPLLGALVLTLAPLAYLHRDAVTAYVGVDRRYRTIFTTAALISCFVLVIAVRVFLEMLLEMS